MEYPAAAGGAADHSFRPLEFARSGANSSEYFSSSILTAIVVLDTTWTRAHGMLESSPRCRAMLRAMRKRNLPEPFKARREPTWVVVRDRFSQVVAMTELKPHADLRAALTAARAARIAQQWECEAIGDSAGFFFCTRDGVRQLVSIEARAPPAVGKRW